ncbi:MAG: Imm63 family immunity protein [Sulfitobacter sp.]
MNHPPFEQTNVQTLYSDLQARFPKLNTLLGVASDPHLFSGMNGGDGQLQRHVVLQEDLWKLRHVERSKVTKETVSKSADDILYEIFSIRAWSIAYQEALRSGLPSGPKLRAFWHTRSLELLASLDPEWAERKRRELPRNGYL